MNYEADQTLPPSLNLHKTVLCHKLDTSVLLCDCRIFCILPHISAKCEYSILFPHTLAFSTAILVVFVSLLESTFVGIRKWQTMRMSTHYWQERQYYNYSRSDFAVFCPTGAPRFTNYHQIWHSISHYFTCNHHQWLRVK